AGDWIKRTDKRTESIYQIDSIDKDLIKCNFVKNGENWCLHTTKGEIEYATPEEIAAGHRIDESVDQMFKDAIEHGNDLAMVSIEGVEHVSIAQVIRMFEMDKCREAFERFECEKYEANYDDMKKNWDWYESQFGYRYSPDSLRGKGWAIWQEAWQHQQAKVEELQRRNQMLNDNIKEQGQKLVYQNEVIETQAEKLLGLRDEKAELQKRVKWLEDRLKATDTLSKMRAAVIGSFKTQDFNACTRRKMMILKRAEQALKVGEN
ncbi:TPA: hypothetical protein OXK24_003308, partial [Acinetobacter baumannii]|nr:hypothetical protein [Acinetobacter baumannii]HCW3831696.1 hypothetical protein [Acinetobacter baumannii]